MEIENTPTGEEEIELSQEALTAIVNFRDEIDDRGVVSLDEVLGLEEYLSTPIITKTVSKNMLPSIPTETGLNEVKDALKQYTLKEDDIDEINVDKLLYYMYKSVNNLSNLRSLLLAARNIDPVKLDLLSDPKVLLDYHEDTLVDYTNASVTKMLQNGYDVCNKLGITDSPYFEEFKNKVSYDEVVLYKLLSLLKDGDMLVSSVQHNMLSDITYGDVLNIIKDTTLVEKVEKAIKAIYTDLNYYKTGKLDYKTMEIGDLKRTIKRYAYYNDIISDEKSILVLNLFILS